MLILTYAVAHFDEYKEKWKLIIYFTIFRMLVCIDLIRASSLILTLLFISV